VLPPHARLRQELLNLVVELGATGVKVIDRGKVHQDHAVAVRGVVAQLVAPACAEPLSYGLADTPYEAVMTPETMRRELEGL
jgi:hypothetical protein